MAQALRLPSNSCKAHIILHSTEETDVGWNRGVHKCEDITVRTAGKAGDMVLLSDDMPEPGL